MIDQKLEALEDTSIEILEEQLQAASDKQNQTNQILIRLKFELEDIDGQFEDLEERLQQARTKNDDLIRKQAKLEADCEQAGDKLRTLLGNLTEHFKLSFEAAQSQAKEVENLAVAEQSLKDLERAIRAWGQSIWMLLSSMTKLIIALPSSMSNGQIFCRRVIYY